MNDKKKELAKGFKRIFPKGFQAALDILTHLDPSSRKKLIEEMEKKDPKMSHALEDKLVQFPDLIYLTQRMILDLLRDIKVDDLGLALRGSDAKLIDHFLTNLSTNLKKDLSDVLKGGPKPLSEVHKAQQKIMDVVLAKIAKGEIILDKVGSKKEV